MKAYSEFNRLIETALAYRSSKPLLVALHYDLFTSIEKGPRTAPALARRLGLDPRALGVVLDAVAASGFLKKRGPAYANTGFSRRMLVAGSPSYQGHNLRYLERTWDAWSELKTVVKTGRPRRSLLDWIGRDRFSAGYIRAMGEVAKGPARDLARTLDLGRVVRSLDVGCGSGAYSAAIVEKAPGVEAVLLDLPRTLGVTRRLLAGHRAAKRMKFRPGDFLKDSFGEKEFDLVLISNVSHVEDEAGNRALIAKAFRALRPGGRLVIHDYLAGTGGRSSPFVASLAVHLLVFTGRGGVYSEAQYRAWLRGAGFRRIEALPVAAGSVHHSAAVVGHRLN